METLFDVADTPAEGVCGYTSRSHREKYTKTDLKSDIFDMVDALRAPIITYPSPWSAIIPEGVIQAIPTARLIACMEGEEFATIPECVAYIMPACLSFPLNYMWAQIYLYVSTAYMRDFRNIEVPDDIRVDELDDFSLSSLNKLRHWIYTRRRQHLKEVRKSISNELSGDGAVIQVKPQQLELF